MVVSFKSYVCDTGEFSIIRESVHADQDETFPG